MTAICCKTAAATLCQCSLTSQRKQLEIKKQERGLEISCGKSDSLHNTNIKSSGNQSYRLLTNTLVNFFLTMVSHSLDKKFHHFHASNDFLNYSTDVIECAVSRQTQLLRAALKFWGFLFFMKFKYKWGMNLHFNRFWITEHKRVKQTAHRIVHAAVK